MSSYPVNLNITGKVCVVVGGGVVASRKIDSLISCGGVVRVVSPEVCEPLQQMAEENKIQWLQRGYRQDDLDDAFLVIAATDNRVVQNQVTSDAERKNLLLNVVDDPAACSFQVPATVRRGEFLLAVSTGGGSPAFSAKVRRALEEEYGPEYGEYVTLLGKIRQLVISDGGTQVSHKNMFEKLLQSNILPCIKEKNWKSVAVELSNILPDKYDVKEILSDF